MSITYNHITFCLQEPPSYISCIPLPPVYKSVLHKGIGGERVQHAIE